MDYWQPQGGQEAAGFAPLSSYIPKQPAQQPQKPMMDEQAAQMMAAALRGQQQQPTGGNIMPPPPSGGPVTSAGYFGQGMDTKAIGGALGSMFNTPPAPVNAGTSNPGWGTSSYGVAGGW